MNQRLPSATLLWMYKGKNRLRRLQQIEQLDYPDFEIIEVQSQASRNEELPVPLPSSDLCVFWADDDKPVTQAFLREMIQPLCAGESSSANLHFWSGNALAIPTAATTHSCVQWRAGERTLMQWIMPVIDAVKPGERIHIAFSSVEKLAPLNMDPVGFPS